MLSFAEILKHPLTYWVLAIILIVSTGVIGYMLFSTEGMETLMSEVIDDREEAEDFPQIIPVTGEGDGDALFADSPPDTGITDISPKDLLPKSDEIRDFEKAFETGKDGLNRNFIAAGHHIGINTVSSSLRNANQSLRSDPTIPRVDVGPWNNSTILASDVINRKEFQIGSGV